MFRTRQIASKIPDGNWRRQYNSAYLLDPNGRYVDRYDKMHLVPFGEYIPLRTHPSVSGGARAIRRIAERRRAPNHFSDDKSGQTLKFGVLICYEDTDSELARRLRRDGADFFVNISNDAWFGLSELDQHFVTARFRAVENRVGVVRSGNNGLSGLIDPLGRPKSFSDKNQIGHATGDLWITRQPLGIYAGRRLARRWRVGPYPDPAKSLDAKRTAGSTATRQGIMLPLYE